MSEEMIIRERIKDLNITDNMLDFNHIVDISLKSRYFVDKHVEKKPELKENCLTGNFQQNDFFVALKNNGFDYKEGSGKNYNILLDGKKLYTFSSKRRNFATFVGLEKVLAEWYNIDNINLSRFFTDVDLQLLKIHNPERYKEIINDDTFILRKDVLNQIEILRGELSNLVEKATKIF